MDPCLSSSSAQPKEFECESEDDTDVCGICLDNVPGESAELSTVILSGCSHSHFHYDCLVRWSATSNTCPTCRARFETIVNATTKAVTKVGHQDQVPDTGDASEQDLVAGGDDVVIYPAELEAICYVCRSGSNDAELLLCDYHCGRGCHVGCAGLDAIPEGDWFCQLCCAASAPTVNISGGNDNIPIVEVERRIDSIQATGMAGGGIQLRPQRMARREETSSVSSNPVPRRSARTRASERTTMVSIASDGLLNSLASSSSATATAADYEASTLNTELDVAWNDCLLAQRDDEAASAKTRKRYRATAVERARSFVLQMENAAADDELVRSTAAQQGALVAETRSRVRLLPRIVERFSEARRYQEVTPLIDAGILSALRGWICRRRWGLRKEDEYLRSVVLTLLTSFGRTGKNDVASSFTHEVLQASGLPKAVFEVAVARSECASNRRRARRLMETWSRLFASSGGRRQRRQRRHYASAEAMAGPAVPAQKRPRRWVRQAAQKESGSSLASNHSTRSTAVPGRPTHLYSISKLSREPHSAKTISSQLFGRNMTKDRHSSQASLIAEACAKDLNRTVVTVSKADSTIDLSYSAAAAASSLARKSNGADLPVVNYFEAVSAAKRRRRRQQDHRRSTTTSGSLSDDAKKRSASAKMCGVHGSSSYADTALRERHLAVHSAVANEVKRCLQAKAPNEDRSVFKLVARTATIAFLNEMFPKRVAVTSAQLAADKNTNDVLPMEIGDEPSKVVICKTFGFKNTSEFRDIVKQKVKVALKAAKKNC